MSHKMITNNEKIDEKIAELESSVNQEVLQEVSKEDKEFVKCHTYLSNEEISMINQQGVNIIKQLHSEGMNSKDITDLISRIFEYHENKQKEEMKEKIDKEIEAKNFKENISFNGREFVYEKFVVIDSCKAVIEQKTFKSKNSYHQWVRMNKKLSAKKESSKKESSKKK